VNSNGTLNTSFNPGTGPDNTVFALCWQPNGQLLWVALSPISMALVQRDCPAQHQWQH